MKIFSLAFLFLCQFLSFYQALELPQPSPLRDSVQIQKRDKSAAANIVFKSTDGGQTWQDISKGLPENLEEGGFYANESGLWLRAGKGTYHSNPNSITPFWQKEIFPDKWSSIAAGKHGMFAYNYWGQIVQKINGTTVWSPVYTNFKGNIRTVFETAGGTIFIGSDNGLYKSTDNGKNWKHVHVGGWVIKMVEQNGVLVATSMGGIIRSADDGENWALVISEGGVGIDVAPIKGGFAAITFNTQSNTRRIRTSYDGGKTWQPIDAGLQVQAFIAPLGKLLFQVDQPDSVWHSNNTSLPEQAFITSIIQVGEYFFCGHPKGIFRSADKGKTWKLILPTIENKVFNLYGSGKVIYAIPKNGGC
jgi:photosystem II stability/assembly factor-like uncharacterized protein